MAADIALVLLALAAAAWTLLFDVLCVGSCTDTPSAGLLTALAVGCAGVGSVLVVGRRAQRLGRVLLAATIAIAVVSAFAG